MKDNVSSLANVSLWSGEWTWVFCRHSCAWLSCSYLFIQLLLFRCQQSLNEWPVIFLFESLVYLHPSGGFYLLPLSRNTTAQCLLTWIDQDPLKTEALATCQPADVGFSVSQWKKEHMIITRCRVPAHTCWWPPGWHFMKYTTLKLGIQKKLLKGPLVSREVAKICHE